MMEEESTCMSTSSSDESDSDICGESFKKKKEKLGLSAKFNRQKFRESWKDEEIFSGWLQKSPRSTLAKDWAFCTICNCDITCGRSELTRHQQSKRHKKFAELWKDHSTFQGKITLVLNCLITLNILEWKYFIMQK